MPAASENVDQMLSLSLVRISESGAIAAAALVGRGDEEAADQAAISAMYATMDQMEIAGNIVIGEGAKGEADTLFVGQSVGTGNGADVDFAVDPLQGTTLAAKGLPDALSVVALAAKGVLLQAPDVYMDKLAVGPAYSPELISLDMSPSARIAALVKAKGCHVSDIGVCMLERPRHDELIAEVRDTGARVRLISDGDLAGVIRCADPQQTGIDIYMGSGGAPEGVLAAAALKCLGGHMEGRLMVRSPDDRLRILDAGIDDPDRIYLRDDMVSGDVIFAATGVTDGALVKGVSRTGSRLEVHSLLMRSKTGSVRRISLSCKP